MKINFVEKIKNTINSKIDPHYIKFADDPTEELQLAAVKLGVCNFLYIKNPSEEVQLEAIKQDDSIIIYIKDPSYKVQLAAVKKNGYAIQYIKNPLKEIQLEAIRQNYALEIIAMCPDWKEFAEEIYDHLNIKDIIE